MRHLRASGETLQIFRSTTPVNAAALKLDQDIGTVQVGKRANLPLLQQDPTRLDPAELAADHNAD